MEEYKKLYTSKKINIFIFLVFFIMAFSISITAISEEMDVELWGMILFSFIISFYFLLNSIPNSSYLLLTPQGFTVRNLFHSKSYKWEDIKNFYVTPKKLVAWEFGDNFQKELILKTVGKFLFGYENALPDNYRMKPEELAEMLSSWKNRFVK